MGLPIDDPDWYGEVDQDDKEILTLAQTMENALKQIGAAFAVPIAQIGTAIEQTMNAYSTAVWCCEAGAAAAPTPCPWHGLTADQQRARALENRAKSGQYNAGFAIDASTSRRPKHIR